MRLHDRAALRTGFRPLLITAPYRAPRPPQRYGVGKRLIAGAANRDLAGPIDDLARRMR